MDPYAYRISRCTDPSKAPQELHWAVLDGVSVERELVTAVVPHAPLAAMPRRGYPSVAPPDRDV